MIVCKHYLEGYTVVEDDKTYYWMFADLFTGDAPEELPTNAVGILNFPQHHNLEDVRFAAGSTLYAVNSKTKYMANDLGEFTQQ